MFREKEGFLSKSSADDVFIGQNYRMSEITGAIAIEQLKKLDYIVESMRKIKYNIKDQIRDIPGIGFRRINDEEGDAGNSLIIYLENPESERILEALNAEEFSELSL